MTGARTCTCACCTGLMSYVRSRPSGSFAVSAVAAARRTRSPPEVTSRGAPSLRINHDSCMCTSIHKASSHHGLHSRSQSHYAHAAPRYCIDRLYDRRRATHARSNHKSSAARSACKAQVHPSESPSTLYVALLQSLGRWSRRQRSEIRRRFVRTSKRRRAI